MMRKPHGPGDRIALAMLTQRPSAFNLDSLNEETAQAALYIASKRAFPARIDIATEDVAERILRMAPAVRAQLLHDAQQQYVA